MHRIYALISLTLFSVFTGMLVITFLLFDGSVRHFAIPIFLMSVFYFGLSIIYAMYVFKMSIIELAKPTKVFKLSKNTVTKIKKVYKSIDINKLNSFVSALVVSLLLYFSIVAIGVYVQNSQVKSLMNNYCELQASPDAKLTTNDSNFNSGKSYEVKQYVDSLEKKLYEESEQDFFSVNQKNFSDVSSDHNFSLSYLESVPASTGLDNTYLYGISFCPAKDRDCTRLGYIELGDVVEFSQDEVIQGFTFDEIVVDMAPDQEFFVVKITTSDRYLELMLVPNGIDYYGSSTYSLFPNNSLSSYELLDISVIENTTDTFVISVDQLGYDTEEYVEYKLINNPNSNSYSFSL